MLYIIRICEEGKKKKEYRTPNKEYRMSKGKKKKNEEGKKKKEYLQGTKLLVLEEDHHAFRLPTTGAIVKDEFYFIATSFIDKWKKKLPAVEPVLIMKVKIKKIK
jgi:hypothetical protein